MKSTLLAMTLLLGTGTALPALAAMPATSSHDAAASAVETVQYRQAPRQRRNSARVARPRRGYNAYARQNDPPAPARRRSGWPCEGRSESSAYSAFPSWEICN